MGRLAPPVVLVAGSRPVGQLPVKELSSSTVSEPPVTGVPDAAAPEELVDPEPPPPPQAARSRAAITGRTSFVRCLIWVLLWRVVGAHAGGRGLRVLRRAAVSPTGVMRLTNCSDRFGDPPSPGGAASGPWKRTSAPATPAAGHGRRRTAGG